LHLLKSLLKKYNNTYLEDNKYNSKGAIILNVAPFFIFILAIMIPTILL